ncbi:galactosylceramide sulfotransferase-like [Pomacea canaliculata]|uniref:galactosylceramide sulfotransferase-like n=1 Tax=Pomacea canaliculata TaxID=400727 RepID=UPI000D73C392|nr:galactosylceramide sulfotransferase-like [Pomacea canaliculata]XP_025104214.1 galactosylceramide sulfotransferase-like [Pomacea canaliculata]XP_025104215.1 galactosylceramide sulfotransferase-like [Pomacea canaliculata]XP_025104216.1 galactosylceramide sulfotransferase-like [Pomacea canaliculata]
MARFRTVCRGRPSLMRTVFFAAFLYLLSILYINSNYLRAHWSSRSSGMGQSYSEDLPADFWSRPPHQGARTCRPRSNFVFIKCMKCASETMASVLRRYTYRRNLSAVLPVGKRLYLGWPYTMTSDDFRPSRRGYNALIEHAIYNSSSMRALMPPDTVFITMIREPFQHFVSVLNYFNVFNLSNTRVRQGIAAVRDYLRHIEEYDAVYKSAQAAPKRYCIPDDFSITKNLLSHCLGMPTGFPLGMANITGNPEAVGQYIQDLDAEFSLVMIMEYFDESLVLLRRLMCWDTKDILYRTVNVGSYQKNFTVAALSSEEASVHRNWCQVDIRLYEHFNRSFWKKIRQQGADFVHEVVYFKQVLQAVKSFCDKKASYGDSRIEFPESRWSLPFMSWPKSAASLLATSLTFLTV